MQVIADLQIISIIFRRLSVRLSCEIGSWELCRIQDEAIQITDNPFCGVMSALVLFFVFCLLVCGLSSRLS